MAGKNFNYFAPVTCICIPSGCSNKETNELRDKIKNDEYFAFTKQKALEIMKTGFNAGDGYREVWIRDYNTFIELSSRVFPAVN